MEELVTIIVPIYNAEDTLPRCLDSLRRQSERRIQVILADDGSSDTSLDIAECCCAQDDRFQLLRLSHGGVSAARNRALEEARGEWVQFCDSDDWLEPEATETLLQAVQESDSQLAVCGFYRVIGEHRYPKAHIPVSGPISRTQYAEYMLQAPANFYYGVVWNKLYRRELIQAYGLCFDPEISWCEDLRFNMEYLLHVSTVAAVHRPVYNYLKRRGSAVSTQATLRSTVQMKLEFLEYYRQLYRALDLYEENKGKINRFLLSAARDGGPNLVLPRRTRGEKPPRRQYRGRKRARQGRKRRQDRGREK